MRRTGPSTGAAKKRALTLSKESLGALGPDQLAGLAGGTRTLENTCRICLAGTILECVPTMAPCHHSVDLCVPTMAPCYHTVDICIRTGDSDCVC